MEKEEHKKTVYAEKTKDKERQLTITKIENVPYGYYIENFKGSVSLSDLIVMRDFLSSVIKDNQL